jgi:hypothetical protein
MDVGSCTALRVLSRTFPPVSLLRFALQSGQAGSSLELSEIALVVVRTLSSGQRIPSWDMKHLRVLSSRSPPANVRPVRTDRSIAKHLTLPRSPQPAH